MKNPHKVTYTLGTALSQSVQQFSFLNLTVISSGTQVLKTEL
jgi:hypothetical protein